MKKVFRLVAVVAATVMAATTFVAPATAATKVKVGLAYDMVDVAISHSTIQQQQVLILQRRS